MSKLFRARGFIYSFGRTEWHMGSIPGRGESGEGLRWLMSGMWISGGGGVKLVWDAQQLCCPLAASSWKQLGFSAQQVIGIRVAPPMCLILVASVLPFSLVFLYILALLISGWGQTKVAPLVLPQKAREAGHSPHFPFLCKRNPFYLENFLLALSCAGLGVGQCRQN